MQLRGAARNSLNQGPFAGGGTAESEEALGEAAGSALAVRPTSGSLARISSSPEVERDRAEAAAEREAAEAEAVSEGEQQPSTESGGAASAPGGVPQRKQPPGEEAGEPDDSAAEDADTDGGEEEDDSRPPGPAVVSLVPSKTVYQVGEVVVVQVVIDNAWNVGSVPFHLRFNKDVLQFMPPATEGPFLKSDGSATVFLASDTGGGGEVVVGLSRLGAGQGMAGSGMLGIFQFQAINPGSCDFGFTGASVKNPQAGNLPAAFQTAPVRVE
jgi:hypothetical protein